MNKLKKHEGSTTFWAVGGMVVFISLCLCLIIFARSTVLSVNRFVEDTITSSVLGAALVDRDRYAIMGDVYIDNPNTCYQNFCNLFSKNAQTDAFSNGTAYGSEDHPFIDFGDGNYVKINKFIIYDIPHKGVYNPTTGKYELRGEKHSLAGTIMSTGSDSDGVGNYIYGTYDDIDNITYTEKSPKMTTATGTEEDVTITKTCIFVEMEIPLRINFRNPFTQEKIEGTVIKAQLIDIEKVNP